LQNVNEFLTNRKNAGRRAGDLAKAAERKRVGGLEPERMTWMQHKREIVSSRAAIHGSRLSARLRSRCHSKPTFLPLKLTSGRSFYANRARHFLVEDARAIAGQLSGRHVAFLLLSSSSKSDQ